MQEAARQALAMAEQHRMQASGNQPPQDGEPIWPVLSAVCIAALPGCTRVWRPWHASRWSPALQQALCLDSARFWRACDMR